MEDVSETGAKLTVEGSVEGLHLKEFFLLLSSTGLAYRRCELAWVNGDQIGVNFLKTGDKKKKQGRRARRSIGKAFSSEVGTGSLSKTRQNQVVAESSSPPVMASQASCAAGIAVI